MVNDQKNNLMMTTVPKMKVEVWSDIMCPFCYIGKRNYEAALEQFADRNNVEIEWHSFQLDPTIPAHTEKKAGVYQYLADRKGISYEQSVKMHERIIQTAKDAGLTYHLDKAIVANSYDAHKMIQLAKTKGLGDAAEERLFLAYFTEGADMGDPEQLLKLGKEIGLPEADILGALESDGYAYLVKQDIQEAQSIGVTGVPFFVFNRKYAVSGAQPPQIFLQTLEQSFKEWERAE
jgi:predicted DsbA family dithiol-disulfide isomerase